MKSRLPARLRRPLALACGLGLALGLSACGVTSVPSSEENNGVYVTAGPVTYQLEISRQLNQFSTEDSAYVKGLSSQDASINPSQLWYGVFLWAKNQTSHPVATNQRFDIVDTVGNRYYPLPLKRALNPFAWKPQTLAPGAIQPGADTVASFGPTQGELLLFKLNNSVYNNRPLMLQIRSPQGKLWASVQLDL